jgi:ER lumen protein retaining receptor
MTRVFARTREREKAWKWGAYTTVASMLAAPLICLTFNGPQRTTFFEVLWTFSIILESVCVLPQLMLLRQTTVPTVIDSFYLVTLGSYRAFYILNWIYRAFTSSKPDAISVIFGIVQTAFYIDFAWVYWTRQRVKLRGGGVVDADDMRKSWLVNRAIKPNGQIPEDDVEAGDEETNGQTPRPDTNRWGARGISISADDTLQDHDKGKRVVRGSGSTPEADPMLSPDAFEDIDDDVPELDEPSNKVLNSDDEWRDETAQK